MLVQHLNEFVSGIYERLKNGKIEDGYKGINNMVDLQVLTNDEREKLNERVRMHTALTEDGLIIMTFTIEHKFGDGIALRAIHDRYNN